MPRRKKIEEKKPARRGQKPAEAKKKTRKLKIEPRPEEADKGRQKSDYLVDLRAEKAAEPLSEIEYMEKLEKEKKIVMWSGVTFLMLAIVVIWFFNIRNVFQAIPQSNAGDSLDWKEITDNFSKSMDEAKSGLEEIKNQPAPVASSSPAVLPADNSASGTPAVRLDNGLTGETADGSDDASVPAAPEQADLNELRNKIDELEKKLRANQ